MKNITKAKKHIKSMIYYKYNTDDIIDYIKALQASGFVDTKGLHILLDYHYSLQNTL